MRNKIKTACVSCGTSFVQVEGDGFIFCMSCESVLRASRSFPMEVGA